jgi:hypothetical protein
MFIIHEHVINMNTVMKCNRCGKPFTENDKPFIDKRYCYGKFKDGKYRFGLFCIKCEPAPKMLDHRH